MLKAPLSYISSRLWPKSAQSKKSILSLNNSISCFLTSTEISTRFYRCSACGIRHPKDIVTPEHLKKDHLMRKVSLNFSQAEGSHIPIRTKVLEKPKVVVIEKEIEDEDLRKWLEERENAMIRSFNPIRFISKQN